MRKTVAVEDGLGPVEDLLKKEGFQVVGMASSDLRRADAIVVTGGDHNFMNMQDIKAEAPVIEAAGRTPEDILNDLKQRLL